mgnify:CR=1 FL=1
MNTVKRNRAFYAAVDHCGTVFMSSVFMSMR